MKAILGVELLPPNNNNLIIGIMNYLSKYSLAISEIFKPLRRQTLVK